MFKATELIANEVKLKAWPLDIPLSQYPSFWFDLQTISLYAIFFVLSLYNTKVTRHDTRNLMWPKESHNRLAWSTCSTEISDIVLCLTRMAQPLVGLYYLLAASMSFSSLFIFSILFRSVLFSTRDRFLSILFASLLFYSILLVSIFAHDSMDFTLYKPLYE